LSIEKRGRDRQITLGGEEIRNRADVMIDAENLLDHDNAAARTPGRIGAPRADLDAVARFQGDEPAHSQILPSYRSVRIYAAAVPARAERSAIQMPATTRQSAAA
jgi:hypothetical protein